MYLYCSTHTSLAAGELVLPLCPHQQLVFARSYPGKPNYILSFILGICLFQYLLVFHSIWLSFCLVVHHSDCLPNEHSKRNQQCQFNYFSRFSVDIITLRCYLVQFGKSMLRLFIWCFLKQSSLQCIIPTLKISSESELFIHLFSIISCLYLFILCIHLFICLFICLFDVFSNSLKQPTALHHTHPKNIIIIWKCIFVYSFVYYQPQKYHHNQRVYICLL